MKNTALITGASSGIGAELARYHASKKGDLVLVARRENELNQLKTELEEQHQINALVIKADLSQANSANDIFEATQKEGIQIDILINNAGFGGHGEFYQRDHQKDQEMIQVNISSLIKLTHLYLQGMVERKHGKILNVASTAGLLPGPLQAVYYATKSFVVSFSQAIAEELRNTNVSVTALCPGAVSTEFAKEADLEDLFFLKTAASAKSVAKCGYDGMNKGKLIVINDKLLGFMVTWLVPLLPRKWVLFFSRKTMEMT